MPTYVPAPQPQDVVPAGVHAVAYAAQQSGGATPSPVSGTTAHPIAG